MANFQLQGAWTTQAVVDYRGSLPDERSRQLFDGVRMLVAQGDTAAVTSIYAALRGNFPPYTEVDKAREVLLQAKLPLAAEALTVICHSDPRVVISAFTRIPEEKRAPLATYLYDRYNPGNNPLNFMKVTSAAVNLYAQTPETERATADTILQLADMYGFGNGQFNLHTVSHIAGDLHHPAAALHLLQWLLARYPDDTTLQAQAFAGLMQGTMGFSTSDKVTMIGSMLDTLPPHYARRMRGPFYRAIYQYPKVAETISLAALSTNTDQLIAAESYCGQEQYPEAATRYAAVLKNTREPLSRRLAAWSGLWDAAPDQAVDATPALTEEILRLPAGPQRTALIRWFGAEMGRVAPAITNGAATLKSPRATSPACYTVMAAAMTRLLQTDPIACLRLENTNGTSLRYAATLVYTLAKQGPEANAVLAQTVSYREYPRPGTRYAPTMAKLHEEITCTAPRVGETDEVAQQVTNTLTTYTKSFGNTGTAMVTPEPPNRQLIINACTSLANCTNADEAKNTLASLGAQLTFAVKYLDPQPDGLSLNAPLPTPRAVNLDYLSPIAEAITRAMQNDLVAKNAGPFIRDGLQASMLKACNPKLLDALFDLSLKVLDRSVAASNNSDAIRGYISNYMNYINGRQLWDLKPYGEQLRTRYLAQEAK